MEHTWVFNYFVVLNFVLDHIPEKLIKAMTVFQKMAYSHSFLPLLTDTVPYHHPHSVDPHCGGCPQVAGSPCPSSSPFHWSYVVVSKGSTWSYSKDLLSDMLMTHTESLKNNCTPELSSGWPTFRKLLLKTLKDWVRPMRFLEEFQRTWVAFWRGLIDPQVGKDPGLMCCFSAMLMALASPLPQGLNIHFPLGRPCSPHLFHLVLSLPSGLWLDTTSPRTLPLIP